MKTKIVWLVAGCLMVVALLLASCAPVVAPAPTPTPSPTPTPTLTPTPTGPEMVKVKAVKTDGTVVEKLVEKPKYGGTLTVLMDAFPTGFDERFTRSDYCRANFLTYDRLLWGDWTKGAAGTGEAGWFYADWPDLKLLAGGLAESWELADPETIVYHIRRGIRFEDKPPVNGREMDANDVVYSIERLMEIQTNFRTQLPPGGLESYVAPDKWTVVVKCGKGATSEVLKYVSSSFSVVPREMVEKYGDLRLWENTCGTGPFRLVDYVSQSSATFEKNPNYWMKDPFFPESQLPYLDEVKWLLVTDMSTALAAMRTDKADQLKTVAFEDAENLIRSNPKLKYIRIFEANNSQIAMRVDTKPFDDLRVRQALTMAIDFKGIAKDYYAGNAQVFAWPVMPLPEYRNYYVPPEELPASVQELFNYNPEKAKKLLAEAGYPNGFKTEIVCHQQFVDLLSVVKSYWDKIGVDLRLDIKEYAVWSSIKASMTHKQMIFNYKGYGLPFSMTNYRAGAANNLSIINDQRTNEAYAAINANFFNQPERDRLFREWTPYCLEQCWFVYLPLVNVVTFWEPWLKNYSGEWSVGNNQRENWVRFVWIDQDLRQEMTGRK